MSVGILVFAVPDDRMSDEVKRAYDALEAAGFVMIPSNTAAFEDALRRGVRLLDGDTIPDAPPTMS